MRQFSGRKSLALPSALDMIYPSQSHGAPCPVTCATAACCLLPLLCCVSVCRAAMLLRGVSCVLAVGCGLAVSRVAFPYRHEVVVGVGDREETKRPRKTESVFRFRFFFQPKKRLKKSIFGWKNRPKTDRKNDFRVSVHDTGGHTHRLKIARTVVVHVCCRTNRTRQHLETKQAGRWRRENGPGSFANSPRFCLWRLGFWLGPVSSRGTVVSVRENGCVAVGIFGVLPRTEAFF